MPTYVITGPDGKKYKIKGAGSKEEALSAFKRKTGGAPKQPSVEQPISPQPAQPSAPLNWSDVPGQAASNFGRSAYDFGAGMVDAVSHPIQTIDNIGQLGAGAIANGLSYIPGMEYAAEGPMQDKARAAGQFYADRYGSMDALKNTLATDPVGALADASTVFTGGESIASRLPVINKAAPALKAAASATNPLVVPVKGAQLAGKATGAGAKLYSGLATGTNYETIGEAVKAGRTGGQDQATLLRNLRDNGSLQEEVVQSTRGALDNMDAARAATYEKDIAPILADRTPVDTGPIDDAMNRLMDGAYRNGRQVYSDETMTKLKQIGQVIDEFTSNPSPMDIGAIDALKRRIGDLQPSALEAGNAGRVVTDMYNVVRDLAVAKNPEYAKVMKDYASSKAQTDEIRKSLSLGKNSTMDSALRKLQSVTRNNAQTNYGSRLKSAQVLQDAGASDLMPALAGQALNAKLPRGLMKYAAGGGAALVAALANPAVAAAAVPALLSTSPRLVGEAAVLAGRLQRYGKKLPLPTKAQLLLAELLNNAASTEQK